MRNKQQASREVNQRYVIRIRNIGIRRQMQLNTIRHKNKRNKALCYAWALDWHMQYSCILFNPQDPNVPHMEQLLRYVLVTRTPLLYVNA